MKKIISLSILSFLFSLSFATTILSEDSEIEHEQPSQHDEPFIECSWWHISWICSCDETNESNGY